MKLLSVSLFVLFAINALAQDITIRYGDIQSLKGLSALYMQLGGNTENQIAFYRQGMSNPLHYFADPLKSEMTLAQPQEWDPSGERKSMSFAAIKKIFSRRDGYTVFYDNTVQTHIHMNLHSNFNPSHDYVYGFFANKFSTRGIASPSTLLDSIALWGGTPVYEVVPNKDSSLYLVCAWGLIDRTVHFIFDIVNADLTTKARGSFEVPDESETFRPLSYALDDNGDVLILTLSDSKDDGNNCTLLNYSSTTKKMTELTLQKNGGAAFTTPAFARDEAGRLYVVACWGPKATKCKGVVVGRLNADASKFDFYYPKSYATDFKWLEASQDRGEGFSIPSIYSLSDNGLLVVFEDTRAVGYITRMRGGVVVGSGRTCTDAFCIALNSNGDVRFFTDIPKKQIATTINLLGSVFLKTDKFLYVIYNDKLQNLNETVWKQMRDFRSTGDAGAVVAKVDLSNGTYTKSLLTKDAPEKETCLATEQAINLDSHTLLLPTSDVHANSKSGFRFAKVSVQ